MEKINELLVKLNNRVPSSIAKKIDGFKDLNKRLALAEDENRENPTEESEESLSDIQEYINDYQDELVEKLEDLVEEKAKQTASSKEVPPVVPVAPVKPAVASTEKGGKDEKEKSGLGIGSIIFGTVLLVGSLGMINYFQNKR